MPTTNKTPFKKEWLAAALVLSLLFTPLLSPAQGKVITVSADNELFTKVLRSIEKQSDYLFFYNNDEVGATKRVTVNVTSDDINVIAAAVGKAASLSYKIKDRHVVFTAVEIKAAPAAGRKQTVYGVVSDGKQKPILGVAVGIRGTTVGTTTDINGKFAVQASPDDILEFSFVGFATQNMRVGNRTQINVEMTEDVLSIDEVVVIGYGEVKKSDLTGAVGTVKMKDIEAIPVSRVDQMLQGRIAGMEVMSTSGEPGAGTSIRIRGTRSINASNEPLYVVDGVMDAINDLNDINPSDIESMDVLKDASSTAIYGSRGSNGVIIITTKQGQPSARDKVTFKVDLGMAELPAHLELMNASEFAQYRNDYFFMNNVANQTKPLEDYPYPNPLALGEGTNWEKAITRKAPYQNYALSLSGGANSWNYYFSANYNDTEGIIKASGQEKWNNRLNLNRQFNSKLKAGFTVSYTYVKDDLNKADVGSYANWSRSALYLAPVIPIYNEDGSLNNWNNFSNNSGGAVFDSPVAYIEQMTKEAVGKSAYLNWNLEYEPIKGLKIKSTVSYLDFNKTTEYLYPGTMPTRAFAGSGARAYKAESHSNNILNENTVKYKKTFCKNHTIDLLGGFTAQKLWWSAMSVDGEGYMVDEMGVDNMGAIPDKNNLNPASSASEKQVMSFIARADYNYKGKYYLTVTGRADGASNFSKNNKWGYFPSAAVKWNAAKEKFMAKAKWINELSVRASAGISGNDAISNYQSLSAFNSSTSGYIFGEQIPVSFYPSRLANDNLTWEKTTSYNLGLDLGFLQNKIKVTVDAYKSYTEDLLLSVQLPNQTGYASRLMNLGEVSNKGIEVTVSTRNIRTNRFAWETSFTFSRNKQMVENIGGEEMVVAFAASTTNYAMMGYKKGYPLNALWGMRYGGTWKTADEVTRNNYTNTYVSPYVAFYAPGKPRYIDRNKDGNLDNDDLFYLGNADPDFYGGLQNTFTIYGVKLNVFFNYSIGGKIYNVSELYMATGSVLSNQYRYMTQGWHPYRNPDSDIPSPNSQDYVPNDRFVYDASFIRLKNLSASYTFDLEKVTNKTLRDVTFTVSGNNLWLWKKYNGYDPEVSTSASGSTIRRMDNGAYPSNRTIAFSIQLRY